VEADIVVDLQYGDTGKGKVTHSLCATRKYTHVLRYNGGCNAGHTIFHKGKKFVTHHIPAGVFWGVKSIIGAGCVLDPEQFFKELKELEAGGIKTKGKIFVATNTHIITAAHKTEDTKDARIGTTKRGNGPAYRDKYGRTGIRADSIPELKPYLIDLYEEFHHASKKPVILGEGAQGFGLDIDWGDYPYVTSSHCTSAGALLNGIPPQAIRQVWGSAKIYETYVGAKKFEPNEPVFPEIRRIGEEFGATTGRPRQCNWLDLDLLERAIWINGVTHLVFSKVDVLREVKQWAVIVHGKTIRFQSEVKMKQFLMKKFAQLGIKKANIFFSESKERI
jgi:adenylosuccinate synthase